MSEQQKNNRLINIGQILLIIAMSICFFDSVFDYYRDIKESKAIKDFYISEEEYVDVDLKIEESTSTTSKVKKEKENYIAVLKIPKIKLEKGLYNLKSANNDVDKNIQIVSGSSMPDIKNSNLILASHSGNAKISYFKNLNKLEINDKVSIDYKGKTYNYSVVNKYEIAKTGQAKIIRNKNTNTLTLITCVHNTDKQLIVICDIEK